MSTVYLKGEMNSRMVSQLFTSYEGMRKKDQLHIYFTSPGGFCDAEQVMRDFINQRKDSIVITFTGFIASAALHLALNVECERRLMQGTSALAHLPRVDVTLNANKTIADGQDWADNWFKDKNNANLWLSSYEGLLSDEEFKNMKLGHDIHISHKRLIQMFKKQTKLG